MRARSIDMEPIEAIDGIESEDTRPASRASSVAEMEYIAPTTVADPEPSGETAPDSVSDPTDGGRFAHHFTEAGSEIELLGATITILNDITYAGPLVAAEDLESQTIYGTEGDDVIDGGLGNDNIFAFGGNDVIFGGDGDDLIVGGSGIDHIQGGGGVDSIAGGSDIDYLNGGADRDWLRGENGNDLLSGDGGDDLLDGGEGFDILLGGADNDTLMGRTGGDTLFGGIGDDELYGDGLDAAADDGADSLFGEDGNDKLFGLGGSDHLDGGQGNDALNGGGGDDYVTGGAGADRLTGGAGRDTFVINHADIGYSLDTITDFMRNPPINGGDIVDMRVLFDAHTDFTGTTAAQAADQGYLYFRQIGSAGEAGYGTMIYIDPNGSAPDTNPYYHDMPVAFLEGVGIGELGTPGPSYAGLNNHFLV